MKLPNNVVKKCRIYLLKNILSEGHFDHKQKMFKQNIYIMFIFTSHHKLSNSTLTKSFDIFF